MNFADLLHELQASEELLCSESDWQKLDEIVGDIRDKVDDIRYVRERLTFEAEWLKSQIEVMQKRRASLLANKQRLEDYVNWSMHCHEITEFPGNKWRVKVQKNPVAIEAKRQPEMDDFLKHEGLVRRKIEYSWKLGDIKDLALSGELPEDLKADLVPVQSTHVRFYAKKD